MCHLSLLKQVHMPVAIVDSFFVIFMIILLSSGIISTQPLFTDSYKDSLHEEIMQRLVAFCNSQLSKSAPEPVKNQNNIR